MATVPLRRLVDDHQWEAEDLAGRLGIVAHAAFLRAGFVPYGDEPSSGVLLKQVDEIGPSAPRLSRRYTAAELARREGADAAVMEVRAQGSGDVAFKAYLLTRDGERRCLCEAVLDEDTLAPLLACRLADAARALETAEPADMSLWRPLVDWVFPILLLVLCRRNDLPMTGFMSLPDDIKAEILKRLNDGKDLARVECTSKQLQSLVTDRELWKGMYESLSLLTLEVQSSHSSEGLGSWKKRYMEARRRPRRPRLFSSFLDLDDEDEVEGWFAQSMRQMEAALQGVFGSYDDEEGWLARRRREREANLQRLRLRVFDIPSPWVHDFIVQPSESTGFVHLPFVEPEDPLAPPPEPEVAVRGKNAGRRHRNRPRNDYQKKRLGAGAIHSPSSRYKWKHR